MNKLYNFSILVFLVILTMNSCSLVKCRDSKGWRLNLNSFAGKSDTVKKNSKVNTKSNCFISSKFNPKEIVQETPTIVEMPSLLGSQDLLSVTSSKQNSSVIGARNLANGIIARDGFSSSLAPVYKQSVHKAAYRQSGSWHVLALILLLIPLIVGIIFLSIPTLASLGIVIIAVDLLVAIFILEDFLDIDLSWISDLF